MFSVSLVALAITFAPLIRATVPEWGQCGGTGFTGDTTCASGTACVAVNPYYSQCLVGTATTSSVSATSAGTSPSSTQAATSSSAATSPTATPTGFVKVSGQKFMLDDNEFTVVGNNAYWVGLFGYSIADMNAAFADIANSGATSVRTLGFNDVTNPSGIYYQSWSNGVATVNTGPTGLENFDTMVAAAKANGLRLIITLTNNWSDYGGMDVYVSQITGTTNHDWFYTNEDVKAAYKNYVKTFVTRYLNEPGILAWELANEPRCLGSTGTSSGTCTNAVITSWVDEMSAYIKSIDSNHLVAVGDEGFINDPGNPNYPYQGTLGIDFEANLNISTIDFGTFHMYPMSWGGSADPTTWGVQWIADHQAFGVKANKPVIVEEFGVTSDQIDIYPAWFEEIISSGLAGDLPWQAGSHLSVGDTPDDGYAIFPDTPVYALVQEYAATLKARG